MHDQTRRSQRRIAIFSSLLTAALLLQGCGERPADEELVVYSARNEQLIKPLFDRYTKETKQRVRYVTDDAGPLIERLAAEGRKTPADILITVDAGELWNAAERGLLRSTRRHSRRTSPIICRIQRIAGSASRFVPARSCIPRIG